MCLPGVQRLLQEIDLASHSRWRGDCPVCGRENTFLVTKELGTIGYYCFSASCGIRGKLDGRMEKEDIVRAAGPMAEGAKHRFTPPDYFVAVDSRPECMAYLAANHCLDAYKDGRVEIRYDPRQNRVVFLIMKDGECYGASGRALDGAILPKWRIYHVLSVFVFCVMAICDKKSQQPKRVLLVEDCASACSASTVADSIALLGTTFTEVAQEAVKGYETVYVCLDRDASNKAIDIQRRLSYIVKDAQVRLLDRDLKYLEPEEIGRLLDG